MNSGNDQEYDQEERDDLILAIKLFTGRYDWKDNLPTKRYLNADEEFVARKAIARLLLSPKPFDRYLRRQLAALFDPEPETAPFSSSDSTPMERRLDFVPRRRGRISQNLRKLQIAIAVDELRAAQPEKLREDAIDEIAKRFGTSTRTVESALKHMVAVVESARRY
jgi:hypothetical protein